MLAALAGQEHGLHHVGHVDESDVLWLEAHGEVGVLLDTLRHEEVVALARPVHARGPQDDKRQVGALHRVQEPLGSQLTLSVGGVGFRMVAQADVLVGLFLAHGSVDAERTQVDKLLDGHLQCQDGPHQVLRPARVHGVEVFLFQTLRHAGGMDHVVERMPLQLLFQLRLARKVQFDEVYPGIRQVLPRTAPSYSGPHLHAASEALLNNE